MGAFSSAGLLDFILGRGTHRVSYALPLNGRTCREDLFRGLWLRTDESDLHTVLHQRRSNDLNALSCVTTRKCFVLLVFNVVFPLYVSGNILFTGREFTGRDTGLLISEPDV